MLANEAFLNQLIANQYRAIRYYLFFAIGLVFLGSAIVAMTFFFSGWLIPEAFKGLLAIGGGFVSSLGAFQVKEIVSHQERVAIFEIIRAHLQALDQVPESANAAEREKNAAERKRVEDLLWQVVEKTAVR